MFQEAGNSGPILNLDD